jgi:(heptosyl)LPS beta-1,4-glucosyltransferase
VTPPAPSIAAVVLTLNEAKHVAACVETLRWADDVLVFDSFSNDDTVALARSAGARIVQNRFENYAQQRNAALAAVRSEWVFFVDADERMDAALAAEVRTAAASNKHDVWAVPRHNYLFGKLTLGAGWYPDFQARLFRVGHSGYDPARKVHELPVFEGELGKLKRELTHFNYESVAQFHAKQRKYSDYDAQILFNQGVRPKPQNFVLQPLREFNRRFFIWRGYCDGLHGLRLSALMAYYNWCMYRRLAELWRKTG